MPLLTDMGGDRLWRGDIIRLVHNYDLGPGSEPVDLMVFDPHSDGSGLGLMVVSGTKSGATLSIFPAESCPTGTRSLETSWLLRNWNHWFCYTYERNADGALKPVPLEGTLVLRAGEYEITAKDHADSRPS